MEDNTFYLKQSTTMNTPPTLVKSHDPEIIARRIAVVDMLRGIALILLTLGCVLIGFHASSRLQSIPASPMVTFTQYLADAGSLGLILVMGMSFFFFRKYHFSGEKYSLFVVSLLILITYRLFFSASILIISPVITLVVWGSVFAGAFGLGWLLGMLFQNRLLLESEDYAIYMARKHDFRKVMLVFGQSPLFFFVIMLVFVQLLAWITAFSAGYQWHEIDFTNGLWGLPHEFGYQWPRVYLTCFCVLGILYPVCKFYSTFKSTHPYGWLRYV